MMDCCAHSLTRRQWMWSTLASSAAAMVAGCAGPGRPDAPPPAAAAATAAPAAAQAPSAAAARLLRENISVDVHTHAGPTGVTSRQPPSDDLARGMRAGSVSIVCLADVPDGPILGRSAANVLAAVRAPAPGQLYQYHLDRLAWMDELVAGHGVRRVLTAADIQSAHAAGQPAIVLDIEGLDFLEGK